MKQNYQPTDEVTIINPDNFAYGFDGDVLSNNPDASKPLTVILKGNAGTWSFKYSEVAPQGLKSSETTQQINTDELTPAKIKAISKMGVKNVIASLEKESKQKRPYKRRDKTEIKATKPKRPYNKRK